VFHVTLPYAYIGIGWSASIPVLPRHQIRCFTTPLFTMYFHFPQPYATRYRYRIPSDARQLLHLSSASSASRRTTEVATSSLPVSRQNTVINALQQTEGRFSPSPTYSHYVIIAAIRQNASRSARHATDRIRHTPQSQYARSSLSTMSRCFTSFQHVVRD
jgi:hypothetical protein